MDPNNNQPINTNPFAQPTAPQPVSAATPPAQPSQPVQQPTPDPVPASAAPAPTPQAPKSGNKKGIILVVILLILSLGMGFYVFFVKNQLNNKQKTAGGNTSAVIQTVTVTPTAVPATVDQVNISSPDADLKGIEIDVQGL